MVLIYSTFLCCRHKNELESKIAESCCLRQKQVLVWRIPASLSTVILYRTGDTFGTIFLYKAQANLIDGQVEAYFDILLPRQQTYGDLYSFLFHHETQLYLPGVKLAVAAARGSRGWRTSERHPGRAVAAAAGRDGSRAEREAGGAGRGWDGQDLGKWCLAGSRERHIPWAGICLSEIFTCLIMRFLWERA